MATAIGDLVINLAARNRASGVFTAVRKDLGGLASFAKGAIGQFNSVLSGMGGEAGLGGLMAGGGMAAAISGTAALYRTQYDAERKLQAVLNATEGAAGLSMQALKEYASSLQAVTNFGDEATISAMAVLATFKEIKGDIFKGAIAAAQDMSTVMGQDMQASVVQLGKALNDPIRGITALSRVGVSFTEQQKAQIKALQESGDIMGAQRIILAELKSEFGGAAEAMADPVTQAKNALGDLGEMLGGRVTPYLKAAAIAMRDYATSATEAQQAVTGLTNAELAQMGVAERMTSLDWWTKGMADLADVAKQTAKLADAAIVEPWQRLANGEDAGDPLAEWWQQFANSKAPSELIDQQIEEMRRKLADAGKTPIPQPPIDGALENAGAIGDAVAQSAKTASDYLSQLQDQIDTFGMDAMQKKFAEIQAAGADDATLGAIADAQRQLRELEEQKKQPQSEPERNAAAEHLAGMAEQIEQLKGNLTDAELALRRFSETPGVTPDQIEDFRRMQKEIAGLEKLESMKNAVADLIEQFRSPAEQLRDEVAKIQELYAGNHIDILTRDKAVREAGDKYAQDQGGTDHPYAGALEKGTAEAYSRILQATAAGRRENQKDAAVKAALETANATIEMRDLMRELVQGDDEELNI
jgi:hypothetical protein